jgi:hypothetical protein
VFEDVRGLLTATSGKVRSAHEEAIEFAQELADTAADLTKAELDDGAILRWSAWVRSEQEGKALLARHSPGACPVQRWLAGARFKVEALLAGCTENPRADYTRSAGIDFEMRRAAALRGIPAPASSPTPPLGEVERRIMEALDGKALTLDALAAQLDRDPSRLHRDHLKPLLDGDHIKNDRRIGGYYRPDALPSG